MKNRNILYTVIGIAAVGLGWFAYVQMDAKKKRKLAAKFYDALEKHYDPIKGAEESDALDVNYVDRIREQVAPQKVCVLSDSKAKSIAKNIASTWGGWLPDDEDKLYDIITNEVANKVQMSQVSKAYYNNEKINLSTDMKNRLSESELKHVMKIINKKDSFKLAQNGKC